MSRPSTPLFSTAPLDPGDDAIGFFAGSSEMANEDTAKILLQKPIEKGECWKAVQKADQKIVGIAIWFEKGDHLELHFLYVDPDTRKKGVGKMLVEKTASVKGRKVRVKTDPKGHGYYLKRGFHIVNEEEMWPKFMEKKF